MTHWTRGSLANECGVNAETIRYYEKAGLMPAPPRTHGGHRVYDVTHVKRLAFIRRCRELGFPVGHVRTLLELVDQQIVSCGEVLDVTLLRLRDVQARIRDLRKMERTLKTLASECSGRDVPECPIVETLWRS